MVASSHTHTYTHTITLSYLLPGRVWAACCLQEPACSLYMTPPPVYEEGIFLWIIFHVLRIYTHTHRQSCTCPLGSVYCWLRSTWALNVSRKSSLMVWWITTLGEFLMGALSLSLSSAYSVEMSLETEGQTHVICCGFLVAQDHTERRMHKHLISKGLTAGLMLSTLRVKICAGEARSGLSWCCLDSVTVTWQSFCKAM